MTQNKWAFSQLITWQNIFSVSSILLIMLYFLLYNYSQYVILCFFILFFLVTAWEMMINMILFSLAAGAIVFLLPFLAPVAFIIMVLLFLVRIEFIITNWKPVLAGFFIYGLAYLLYKESYFLTPIFKLGVSLIQFIPDMIKSMVNFDFFSFCYGNTFAACTIACIFQLLLYWLYRNGYSASGALNIMGSIPLVIIALMLPFLKAAAFDGMFDAGHTGDFAHNADVSHDGYIVKPPDGYHHVNGYERVAPDGHIQHVAGYIRSNPDGIVENNLSYHGNYDAVNGTESIPFSDNTVSHGGKFLPDSFYVMTVGFYNKSVAKIFSLGKSIALIIILLFAAGSLLISTAVYYILLLQVK